MVVYHLCFLLKLVGRIETGNKDAIEHKYDNELTIDDKYTTELYATMYSSTWYVWFVRVLNSR